VHECTQLVPLLDPVRIAGRCRPRRVLGDKAFSTRAIRAWARSAHVQLVVPERRDQIAQRAHRPGRKPQYDRVLYRSRNVIERAVGWFKHARRLATRSEKLAVCFQAMVCLHLTARYATRYFSDTT
jgi:transposase